MLLPLATGVAVATSDRGALEDAAILALQPLHEWNGGPVERIAHYCGEFGRTDDELDRMIQQLMAQRPALLVAAGEARYQRDGVAGRNFRAALTFYVLVVSGHLRGDQARTVGGDAVAGRAAPSSSGLPRRGGDPGVFALMAAVRDLLNARDLAVDNLEPLEIVTEDVVFDAPELTCWRMTFTAGRAETTPPVQALLGRPSPWTSHETRVRIAGEPESRPLAVTLADD